MIKTLSGIRHLSPVTFPIKWIPPVLEISAKMLHKDSTPYNPFPDTIHGIASIKTVKAKLIQIHLSIPLKKGPG